MVLPEQQITPRSSQEEKHDKELEKELNNLFCEKESPITYNVDWIDTDTDEDEDYLPQNLHHQLPSPPRKLSALDYRTPSPPPSGNKRNRVESMSWSPSSAPGPLKKAMHQFPTAFSPSTQHCRRTVRTVQQAINDAIDNGADMVDLSNMDLTEIPDEIRELQHITILSKDLINNSSLKLFLYGNRLTKLSMQLFSLKNLSVLSLRNNKLETIPPEIVLLQNLCELSLGNNMLRYLPGEILRLRKLTIISVLPNPFQNIPEDNTSTPARQIIRSVPTPSLFEICSRAVMASSKRYDNQNMPFRITEHLDVSKNVKRCQNCRCYVIQPDIEVMVWCNLLVCSNVPVIVGFCSMHCLEACHWDKVGLFAGDINC